MDRDALSMIQSDAAIAAALIAYRERLLKDGDEFWPFVRDGTKRGANKFFLACIIDLMQTARRTWEQAQRVVEEIMGDPPDIWRAFLERYSSEEEWMKAKPELGLHRFGWAHSVFIESARH